MPAQVIKISGAREHNVKNLHVEIPREKLIVITGMSGSRKSSIATYVTEKVLPHLEAMPPDSILHRVDQVEKLNRIARRNYGLDSTSGAGCHA